MDRVHVIRHKFFNEGHSIRRIARQIGHSRNTVRKYLQESEPHRREPTAARRRPVLDRVAERIDAILEEWRPRTTAKQRITGTRIHRQLIEEGFQVGSTTVRDYLAGSGASGGKCSCAGVAARRCGAGGLLRGDRGRRRREAQGVEVRHAADVFGTRLRVAV